MYKFVNGFKKKVVDFKLIIRLLFSSILYFGIFKALRQIYNYQKSELNTLKYLSNRYISNKNNTIALPDLPPLFSKDFSEYFISELNFVNNSEPQKFLFAILCITSKCINKCNYCYNIQQHNEKEIIPVEIIIKTIKSLQQINFYNIYLSGGEPSMRFADLLKILNECDTSKTGFWLITTGYNLDKEKLQNLKKAGLRGIMVSLDSSDKLYVDKIKNRQNAFNDAINVLKQASEIGLLTVIDCVLNKKMLSENQFSKYVIFAGSLGVHFINCYSPKSVDFSNSEIEEFTLEEHIQLADLMSKNNSNRNCRNLPLTYNSDFLEAHRGCVGGKTFIYIDPLGNVKKCPFTKKSFGNILDLEIEIIFENFKNDINNGICNTNLLLKNYLNKN